MPAALQRPADGELPGKGRFAWLAGAGVFMMLPDEIRVEKSRPGGTRTRWPGVLGKACRSRSLAAWASGGAAGLFAKV